MAYEQARIFAKRTVSSFRKCNNTITQRVQSDLAEKAVTLNDKTGVSDKNSKPDTSDELRLSDLEDVFQKLSIITPPKEPTIVNDFNVSIQSDIVY